jgi:hypothetical protein
MESTVNFQFENYETVDILTKSKSIKGRFAVNF